jgi:endonuclease G
METARILAELREDLTATRARLELLEDRIDKLSRRLGVPDSTFLNPVAPVRLDDEEHEFVSYPVYLYQDQTNRLLERIGYTTYHDLDHRIPLWVSYKVSQQWLDKPAFIPRSNLRWRTDPELAGLGARDRDYRHSGYSRGHMAMQALLRGRSQECERQGFFFANAAPQRQSFNAGIWLQLEYQVMRWARQYGDVWVVCGPVLSPDPSRLNGRVSVPTGFYKIVTRDTPDGMAVAAYFFMHEAQGATVTLDQSIFTIDAIERRTGLDFFASLPDVYESQIEARRSSLTEPALADGQVTAEDAR